MNISQSQKIPEILGSEEQKAIAAEITELFNKLIEIYKGDYLYEFPPNILQYSHFYELYSKIILDFNENPLKTFKLQEAFLQDCCSLYFSTLNKLMGSHSEEDSVFESPSGDKRFANSEWKECLYFDTLKRIYYLVAKHSLRWLNSITTLDRKSRQQLHFYLKNFLNQNAPSNLFLTNPEVIQKTIETGGENFLIGLKNYLEDLVLNNGRPNVRMTDIKAFAVGKNLAITPGKVIFQNDIMQLIQYLPSTESVYKIPILFVPPWINKYYVLDLSPENSLVKWLVDQGFTVYMISWVNPGPELENKGFSDYMMEGPIAALKVITDTANCSSVHTVGYCIGGTLLSCALAYLATQGDTRVASSTFFMTLLNFSNPGELGVFIDENQINAIDKIMEKKGYFDGRILDMAFNVLRPNDLIWPYFINHYLLGNPAKPFELLYWNADPSNLPRRMNSFYLRSLYLHDSLKVPGKIKLKGVPIHLEAIKTPAFFLASETDHITLWRTVYSGTRLLGGPVQFVLAASGHVMGVINPPSKNKYSYRTSKKFGISKKLPTRSKEWLNSTKEHKGSWWPHWKDWLLNINAEQVSARDPVKQGIRILEDAPGSYVLKRL